MTDAKPPVARRAPSPRSHHGDTFSDPYAWMADRDSPELRDYIEAQNRWCEERTAPLAGLRRTLFDELKSRIQETDMSVPVRLDGYWYFVRTRQGSQYSTQCRLPVAGPDDWTPPEIDPDGDPGSAPGEQVVFDANREAEGHEFFRLGGMDLSRDGRWMLYGVDHEGDERYDYRLRDLTSTLAEGHPVELPETFPAIGGACLTPDAAWVFWVELDDAWRPCAVWRHRVGTPTSDDVEVFRERDERFWVGVGLSFDERRVVIVTGSKTTTEVLMLPLETPEGEFRPFIPRREGIEYDVSFARFEGAGENGADIPLAVVYHNARNPNFEIDVIDLRGHEPPYELGEGVCVAAGSPCGCERGDGVPPSMLPARTDGDDRPPSRMPVSTAYRNPSNPAILDGARGLGIEGIALHRHFVSLAYRADGMPHVAVMTKDQAASDFLAGRPWSFRELTPPGLDDDPCDGSDGAGDGWGLPGRTERLYSVGTGGNPSYEAPRVRYSFSSFTRPGELHEYDPATGDDVTLKRARVLGGVDPRDYRERRVWVTARDGERLPVSLVWRRDRERRGMPLFLTGYGAYEVSSDPSFSVSRLSLLDRGVLYAVPHVRGGGEMGRAWYEQGRRLAKRHTFEDFVDATVALQDCGAADRTRTVAVGGSAGGLLIGAVANMAPDRYAGVEADVPFVDALTSILDPSLPLTVTEWEEWGDPLHDPAAYRYMKSYTPYENLPEAGSAFPRVLVTASTNDTRVLVTEPLKWVAAMQARGFDAIARIEVGAGHGGRSGRYRQWEEISFENAWCLDCMGIGS